MPDWTYFKNYLMLDAKVSWRGATQLAASQYKVRLFEGVSIEQDMEPIDFIQGELLQKNGYALQPYAPVDPVWNSTAKQPEFPKVETEFPAVGESAQFSSIVVWGDSAPLGSKAVDSISTSDSRLLIASHGLTSGDPIALASEGTLPGTLGAGLYYAKVIDTGAIEVCSDSALNSTVLINSVGSGTHYLRYLKGVPVAFVNVQTQATGADTSAAVNITLER